ncbi:hypothetical protein FS749_000523 [Ceratobasidium sp. UAMH 11750]|nr:hypothetical protein FS749_000523 [Ceratobasidium sp. UAMH 11750]
MDRAVNCLRVQAGPNTSAEPKLGGRRVETDAVEKKVIGFAVGSRLFVLLGQDLSVTYKVVPPERVQLLQVPQKSDVRVLVLFADNLAQRQQNPFRIVWGENGKSGHALDGGRFGKGSGNKKVKRMVRWDAIFQLSGRKMNSARVARIMMSVETVSPSAVTDHRIAVVGEAPLARLVVNARRVERSVVPEHGQMNNPDAAQVNKQLYDHALLVIGLDKRILPVDWCEFHEALRGRNINQARFVARRDAGNAFRVPEQLVDAVVSDNILVVLLAANKLALLDLVPLVAQELVDRFNDGVEVESLWSPLGAVMAFGRAMVVAGALEDEAHALERKTKIATLPNTAAKAQSDRADCNGSYCSLQYANGGQRYRVTFRRPTRCIDGPFRQHWRPEFWVLPTALSKSSWAAKYRLR